MYFLKEKTTNWEAVSKMLNRGELCSMVRNDAHDCWRCCQNVRFQTKQYVLLPFQQLKCFQSRSSTLLSIFNRLRSPSLKEEKFLLQRQTAEPLTHSAAPGREQTILLTSGGQWCHGDVNASNCKSHTQTHRHTRAASQSAAFQSERRRLRRGDSQFWKSRQQIEDGCDRGGDRTRYVCFHLFVSCRSEKKIRLYFPNSCWTVANVSGMCLSWKEFGI